MNKQGQAQVHGHYTGDIPFGIWWLIVSIGCIILGSIFKETLGVLLFIGGVLLIFLIGAVVIAFTER